MATDVTGGVLQYFLSQQVAFAVNSFLGQQPAKELYPRDSYILPNKLVQRTGTVTSHGGFVYQP
jgi:hypothetical protein